MSEFTNDTRPEDIASQDRNTTKMSSGEEEPTFKTDVDGVPADGERNGLPVFKVSKHEFYQNMANGRRRLRFSNGSRVQKYMQGTRYKNPFWIEHDGYLRKVK
jgi:hypothetical protein